VFCFHLRVRSVWGLRELDPLLIDVAATSSSTSMSYVYNVLPTENSTRLLRLSPGDHDTSLEAELIPHSVHQDKPYEALSYVWGDPIAHDK
jgi:hypothetical protein